MTTATQRVDDVGRELRAGVGVQLGDRDLERQRLAVRAVGRHRVEGVAGGDDAGGDRDRLAGQAVGIAAAVPALVRGADDDADAGEQAADLLQHPLALDGVGLHDRPLLVVERAGLVDDLVGHGDLADVVQQRAHLGLALRVLVDAHLLGDGAVSSTTSSVWWPVYSSSSSSRSRSSSAVPR